MGGVRDWIAAYFYSVAGVLRLAERKNWNRGAMEKRRTKIIEDNKRRGEWAESVFVARPQRTGCL